MQYKHEVFRSPHVQLRALFEEINAVLSASGYVASVNPIVEPHEFWNIVENNEGQIKEFAITVRPPNLFQLENSFNDDLSHAAKIYNTTEVEIKMRNRENALNLPQNDGFLRESVDYVTRGGGEYKLSIQNGKKIITSGNEAKTKVFEFDTLDIESTDAETFLNAMQRVFR